MNSPSDDEDRADQREPEQPIASGQHGFMPGVDIDDNSALLDLMDEGAPLDKLR